MYLNNQKINNENIILKISVLIVKIKLLSLCSETIPRFNRIIVSLVSKIKAVRVVSF